VARTIGSDAEARALDTGGAWPHTAEAAPRREIEALVQELASRP
jgi:hypothetical protein